MFHINLRKDRVKCNTDRNFVHLIQNGNIYVVEKFTINKKWHRFTMKTYKQIKKKKKKTVQNQLEDG